VKPVDRAGKQFIRGEWVDSSSPATVAVENPATTQVIAHVCQGTEDDAQAAVAAAREAFDAWASTRLADRVDILRRAAAALTENADELTRVISEEVGTPTSVSRTAQVLRPIEVLVSLCDAAEQIHWQQTIDSTLVVREPLGVVVAITPWNFPLHQAIAKVGAALLAGCTMVLKPSELAPLSSYALADALAGAALPDGAFNIVTGLGGTVGEALISHPDVDGISFTGSTAVGRHVGAVAAQSVKRVALELGGKGPSVVLPGADVKAATRATAARCFTNSGQVCAALSRLIVPRGDLADAEQAAHEFAEEQRLGDPFDERTTLGPVISAEQKSRIMTLVGQGAAEGARVVAGGPNVRLPERGHYVAPTVFSDVDASMTIARTEIFGPVLCIIPYDNVEDAVRIANDSEYGLVGAVWGPDDLEAARVAARIRVGMVGVNGGRINVRAPFGGYRQSGNGREFGVRGIEEFLETKSVNFLRDDRVVWPTP
jgi:acyl-CoA reductase-like NAD-dependent aldehyde dehydrogenase